MQGFRDSQEDVYNCSIDYDVGASLFAVFDGHGGRAVAEYTSQKLPDLIKETRAYQTGNYEEALREGFLKFDTSLKFDSSMNPMQPEVIEILKEIETRNQMKKNVICFRRHRKNDLECKLKRLEKEIEIENKTKEKNFLRGTEENEKHKDLSLSIRKLEITRELKDLEEEEHMPFEEVMGKYKWDEKGDGDRTFKKTKFFDINMPGWASGSTAVVVFIKDNKIYVANAGDSRCIISKNGEVLEMSIDHKINGNLDFSRALGDYMYKNSNDISLENQAKPPPFPDVKVIQVDSDVEFILLACDGIWNAMRNKEVLDFVRRRLVNGMEPMSKICEDLFDHILNKRRNNKDNMTAIIVKFKNSNVFLSADKRSDNERENGRKQTKTENGKVIDNLKY